MYRLVALLLVNFVPGSPQQIIDGTHLKIAGTKELPSRIGQVNRVNSLSLPSFQTGVPPTIFSLPPGLLNQFNLGPNTYINIFAVRYSYDINSLTGQLQVPNITLDPHAPIDANNITEVISLGLQENAFQSLFHPSNLAEHIVIRKPLLFSEIPSENSTQLSCGYYDDTVQTWASFGCNVTDFKLPKNSSDMSGYLICSCNHASDYAAWQAFVEDISIVFGQVNTSNLATISALVLGLLLPGLVLLWVGLNVIGYKLDKAESRLIHLGAFVAVTRKKLELHDRQRRFFKILQNNAGEISAKELAKANKELQQMEQVEINAASKLAIDRILILIASGALISASTTMIGCFISYFIQSDSSSLSQLPNFLSTFAVALTFFILNVLIFGMSIFIRVRDESRRLVNLLMLLQVTCTIMGITQFALPSSIVPTSQISVGLGLLIASGSISIVNLLFAISVYFVRLFQDDTLQVGREFVMNIIKGMKYEQTLFSAFLKFDPYYTRQNRFSIIVGVVLGNLFANAVFFSFKYGNVASFGLVFATTVLASFIVAIPVKIMLRILFRLSALETGSKMDRIAHIFRISAFSNDELNPAFASKAQELDVRLLAGFKSYYLAKHNQALLKKAFSEQNQRSKHFPDLNTRKVEVEESGSNKSNIKVTELAVFQKIDHENGDFEFATESKLINSNR